VDVLHDIAGATAIRTQYPLERHFRDIHTLTQHAFGSTSRLESSGRLMLGLENNWGFFPF
jgi:alkylation response protein AidB-like acyl-CoA dehydrogenase